MVHSKKDLQKIIQIFDKISLNTTKYLDYVNWREAFLLYTKIKDFTVDIKTAAPQILLLKQNMNDNRTNFSLPLVHIFISPYWLLGFLEGEAHFGVYKKDFTHVLALDQIEHQKSIINSIQNYLQNFTADFLESFLS